MDIQYVDLLGSSSQTSLDLNIFDSASITNETSKEIMEQQIHYLLDVCIWELPRIASEKISKSIEDITRYLSLHNISQDSRFSEYIVQSLRHSVSDFNFKESLHKSLLKHWSHITSDIENSRTSDLTPRIEEMVSQYYSLFAKLLYSLNEAFLNSIIHTSLFPAVSAFDSFFKEILQDLKNQTTRKKIQLKLCPGVEAPKIKRVQRQITKVIKKPYTEWNTYSAQQTVEVEHQPSCIMVPLIHRLLSYTNQASIHVVSYFAPTGWEVIRVTASIVDGNYKAAVIKRTACRQNKALAEVELTFPRITRDHIWCKVLLEGVLSRKSFQELQIPEFKTVIVTVDQDGEHELPEDLVEEIE